VVTNAVKITTVKSFIAQGHVSIAYGLKKENSLNKSSSDF
jgi:hypothetical protein